jgi:hypothetical protein
VRPSLADRANAQLKGKGRDPLSEGVEDAAVDDCLHAGKPSAAGGLLALPSVAARAVSDRCAK